MLQIKPSQPALNKGHPIAEGMVGFWALSAGGGTTVPDISNTNGKGTFAAGASAPTWSTGKAGKGVAFSAVGLQNIDTRNFAVMSNFTIAAWVYKLTTGAQGVFGQVNSAASDSTFHLRINGGSGYKSGAGFQQVTVPDISLNLWHHVALTVFVGTNGLSFYLDGALNIQATSSLTPDSLTNTAKIGSLGDFSAGQYWNGRMDQVSIWNRTLSAVEIAHLAAFPYCLMQPPYSKNFLRAGIHQARGAKHKFPKIPPKEPRPAYIW